MSQPASPYDPPVQEPPQTPVAPAAPRRHPLWLQALTPLLVVILGVVANGVVSLAAIFVGMFATLGPTGFLDLVAQIREHENASAEEGIDSPVVDVKPPGATDDILAGDAPVDGDGNEGEDEEPNPWETWMLSFVKTPLGFATIVVPGQLAFLGVAVFFALLSPVPFRQRLGLLAPREPWPVWIVFALASPGVTFLANAPMALLVDYEQSESLALFEQIFTSGGIGFFLLMLVGIGVMPAVAEEILFRGYVQSRYAKLLPAWIAILISALFFAVAHLDPIHAMGVLPLGIWIGIVFHRTRSVYPAMACHFCNNAFAVIASRLTPAFLDADESNVDPTRWELWLMAAIMMSTMFFFLVAAAYLLATNFFRELSTVEGAPSGSPGPTPAFAPGSTPAFAPGSTPAFAPGSPTDVAGIQFVSDPGAPRPYDAGGEGIRFLPPRESPSMDDAGDEPRTPPTS